MDLKSSSSILLTTHSMEEAEFLSDRIGILGSGKLQCVGSPARLKSVYGSGYQVHINTTMPERFVSHFLTLNGENMWFVSKKVGTYLVLRRTEKGLQQFHEFVQLYGVQDSSKIKAGYAELHRLYDILENARDSGEYGDITFHVTETTLGEVFESFEKIHNQSLG
jgi:ABC-type multidrug transport system ATPase subunit